MGKGQNMPNKIPKSSKIVNRFCDLIGLQFTEMEKGFCRTELSITDAHLNPYGTLHGGVVYTLADTGMGGALSTLLADDEKCSTIEIKINYLKSRRSGKLICNTKVIHQGKSIAFLESLITDQGDQKVATATGTFNIFKLTSQGKKPSETEGGK
jgi:acyl-CoA thioesterase